MNIIVIGGGAWGTALAIAAAKAHAVTLAVRTDAALEQLQTHQENRAYLPGFALPRELTLSLARDVAGLTSKADLVILATPAAGVPQWLADLPSVSALVWLSKGLVMAKPGLGAACSAQLLHEIAESTAPHQAVGVLSGPSFAQEVAQGLPCALVAASAHAHVRQRLIDAFHGDRMRVYANDDVVGVEVGGAVKNVLAIAAGVCDGLGLGSNARAALLTRGLAEMSRFGVALGARIETFMGLSGLGDLVLTATGDLSRNRRVGLALAQGQSLSQIVASLGHVAEGVLSADAIAGRAQSLGVDMPMVSAVNRLLKGEITPSQAVRELMARGPSQEG